LEVVIISHNRLIWPVTVGEVGDVSLLGDDNLRAVGDKVPGGSLVISFLV